MDLQVRRIRMLVAVAEGASMAGPVGATPPTVDGSGWPQARHRREGERLAAKGNIRAQPAAREKCCEISLDLKSEFGDYGSALGHHDNIVELPYGNRTTLKDLSGL